MLDGAASSTAPRAVDLITAVDGYGQKVVAIAIDYGVDVVDGLSKANFAVQALRTTKAGSEESQSRTITKVYSNAEAGKSASPTPGPYVIIELDPADANSATTYMDAKVGLTQEYELKYLVTQTSELQAVAGLRLQPCSFASTGRINLVVDDFQVLTYEAPSGKRMPYRLFVPKNYDPTKKYPLVMFLHGAGERGTDGNVQLEANAGAAIWAEDAEQAKRECLVVAPQCPPESSWTRRPARESTEITPTAELEMAYAILQETVGNYGVDQERVYLTGISMGGFGTWAMGIAYPKTFAALVPICGGGDPGKAATIADKPIWTFHHAGDPVVSVDMTRNIVRELEKRGDDLYYRPVLYTEYSVGDPITPSNHSSWIPAYRTEAMREWLFEQRLGVGVKKVRHISPNRALPDPPFKDNKIPYGFAVTDYIKEKHLDIRYTNAPDSQKLDIYLPNKGEGPYPVMMYIHGGAYFFGSKDMDDLQPVLYGLDRGYAVVSINYTLIDCTVGKEVMDQTVFPLALYQAKAAVRWIRANAPAYNFDPNKIAVLGTSAGGHLAGLVATTGHEPETEDLSMGNSRFSSAVQAGILAAAANRETPTSLCDCFSTKVENHVDSAGPPILLLHGTEDGAVPYQGSVQLAENLKAVLGEAKVELVSLPRAGHNNDPKFFANDFVDTKRVVYDFTDKVFGISTTRGFEVSRGAHLITEVTPVGEKVTAIAVEYPAAIGFTTVAKSSYTVETVTGREVRPRTVTRVYTNDEPALRATPRDGRYVIIELDATDINAGTTTHDAKERLTLRNNLDYRVVQCDDIYTTKGQRVFGSPGQITKASEIIQVVDDFWKLTYTARNGDILPYRLFQPMVEADKKYPLVLFLHGGGERGSDGTVQMIANRGGVVWAEPKHQQPNPAYVLAPQTPIEGSWTKEEVYSALLELLGYVKAKFPIDPDRIYVTGMSMGGVGTWNIIQENPKMFAAAMPICGIGDPQKAEAVKDMPLWVFHAADDPVVPVSGSREVVAALQALGSKVRYTEYAKGEVSPPLAPGAHASWIPAYENEEAIAWLLAQRRKS